MVALHATAFHDDDLCTACSAAAVCNSLPTTDLNSDSVAVCKSRFKTFLFSRAFSLPASHCLDPAPLKLRPYGAIQICLLLLVVVVV